MLLQFFTNLGQRPAVLWTKKPIRRSTRKVDVVAEQVKGILQKADQKIILMVRG